MINLTGKLKYIGIILLVILVIITQIYFFQKDEPPEFFEVTSTLTINDVEEQQEEEIVIIVDVKGAVNKPGVYEMKEGERIQDVIIKAGGATEEAELNQVNLALKVYDEMVIFIPKKGEILTEELMKINNGKISINQANEAELMMLEGIGPTKAKAIIEYRNKNGSFKKTEDIKNVTGIADKTYEQIKDKITIQ